MTINPPANTRPSWILIMRHGRDLEGKGRTDVVGVASRLQETLLGMNHSRLPNYAITLGATIHADSDMAIRTAKIVAETAPLVPESTVSTVFNPDHASSYSGERYKVERDAAVDEINAIKGTFEPAAVPTGETNRQNAILLIGHLPLMEILTREFSGEGVPLPHAGLACFRRIDHMNVNRLTRTVRWIKRRCLRQEPAKWRLEWTIEPFDQDADNALRTKLGSKMQVSGILAAAVIAGLIFLVEYLFGAVATDGNEVPIGLRRLAATSMLASAALYIACLYYCDRLTMPPRYWNENTNPADLDGRPVWLVARPPSSASRVIYQNMQRVWRRLFVPASAALVIGLLLLGGSLLQPNSVTGWVVTGALVLGVVLMWLFIRSSRPRLGVDD